MSRNHRTNHFQHLNASLTASSHLTTGAIGIGAAAESLDNDAQVIPTVSLEDLPITISNTTQGSSSEEATVLLLDNPQRVTSYAE